ncbi:MAG: hypothetical protein HZC29_00755 [Thaumarchaeota archaeon]|nr:hypothetical protein [Nitrososphaerota archaeon]
MMLTKQSIKKADLEMTKLMQEMDDFDEKFRQSVCNKIENHEDIHTDVITYPTGAVFCDQLRKAKNRNFKKRVYTFLSMVSQNK